MSTIRFTAEALRAQSSQKIIFWSSAICMNTLNVILRSVATKDSQSAVAGRTGQDVRGILRFAQNDRTLFTETADEPNYFFLSDLRASAVKLRFRIGTIEPVLDKRDE